MTKRQVFGYLLIIIGLILPLSALTKMCLAQTKQDQAYEDFKIHVKTMEADQKADKEARIERVKKVKEVPDDPFVVANRTEEGFEDEIFAYVLIPKLDLKRPVYIGATYDNLNKGVAQVEGTSLPLGGRGTRSVIAGHRGWYGDTVFINIDELTPGDMIYLDLGERILTYKVTDQEIIGADEGEKLLPYEGRDVLSLLTCDPIPPPRPNRLIINADRVEDEVEEIPSQGPSTIIKTLTMTGPQSPRTKRLNFGLFVGTGIGWIVVVVVLIGFLKKLFGRKSR